MGSQGDVKVKGLHAKGRSYGGLGLIPIDIFYSYTYIMSRKNAQTNVVPIDWKMVGKRIRELRGFDTTQVELARRIGVSQGYLSTVENGQGEIGAEVLLALSREFDKSLEWLLTGKEKI
jgi:DNA-binding XRE family transcriptional regulator